MKNKGCFGCFGCLGLLVLLVMSFLLFFLGIDDSDTSGSTAGGTEFNGVYTEDLPSYPEIKGVGNVPDEIAQLAVGSAVKYHLLPSVIISQWAYESEWGHSASAKNDNNFFGITWFEGCPFPKGTARGVGGSEGGNYMKFPNKKSAFSYYGYMVASQTNFNACVGNKSPEQCLLTLGRGGYASAGISINSPYFTGCMSIIKSNNLTQYDDFAIKNWKDFGGNTGGTVGGGWGWLFPDVGQGSFSGGQLFGKNAGGEFRENGWHDGLDFGSVDHPGAEIHAVHGGTVTYVGNPNIGGLGACVIVINDSGLNMVYQEFATSTSNAKVKVGDKVKLGDVIGIRDTEHLHLGITKKDWLQAESSAFTDDGTWLDPLKIITTGKY
ncbi:peptidase M23 [Enterococcus faecium]|uniref:glucosaminidase domain-containing protein n=1 Tax=Enterococcus faecium TaxID=1352 RepID=UPI000F501442|nr:glucosaminidase domain-containing protein [Enterococcus faecium]ROX63913.1 peptidase M23 [Enterococcus faecium]ROX65845.1 peptidase M23 [Enterococcus faecium]ROY25591.1 peptidase M23 [Enterococcus faecium]ROY60365.1 peptidase M23 [Enterococcus faecium]ROY76934.1 peptidase M23 [Enterococcus faecium]